MSEYPNPIRTGLFGDRAPYLSELIPLFVNLGCCNFGTQLKWVKSVPYKAILNSI